MRHDCCPAKTVPLVCPRNARNLAGLETQTQNAAFFELKRPKRKPWHRGKSSNRKKSIAMRFLNASVLPRKALNRNLSWGFPLGNLLPKVSVLKHCVLERKRRPNANASVLGTLRFRTLGQGKPPSSKAFRAVFHDFQKANAGRSQEHSRAFLCGLFPVDFKRQNGQNRENGPLRRGNGPLRWCWLAFQSAA